MKKAVIIINFFVFLFVLFSSENIKIKPDIKDEKLIITEELAVSLALANNLNLKIERLKYENSFWSMITSWNVFLPDIKMSATLGKSNLSEDDRTTLVPDFSKFPPVVEKIVSPEWIVTANFTLTLPINAALGFQVYQTILDYKNGKINLEIAKNKLIRDIKKELYNIVLLEQNIDLMEKSLLTAEKRYNQAKTMYKNGLISEYDMLSAQVAYENLKPQLIEMKNLYKTVTMRFKQLLGIKKEVEISINTQIVKEKIEFKTEELLKKLFIKNLELKYLRNNIEILRNLKYLGISSLTPTFIIGYTMDPYFKKDALQNEWFKDEDYNKENWKQRTGMFSLTLSLPVSALIPLSKEQMKVVNAQFQIEQAKISYKNLVENLQLQLETTLMSMEKSREAIKVLNFNISVAERAYQKAEEAYLAGTKDLLDVQNSELELQKAKLNLLKEEYNYTTGLLDLEYILNNNLF